MIMVMFSQCTMVINVIAMIIKTVLKRAMLII